MQHDDDAKTEASLVKLYNSSPITTQDYYLLIKHYEKIESQLISDGEKARCVARLKTFRVRYEAALANEK